MSATQRQLFEVPRFVPACIYCGHAKPEIQSLRSKLETTEGVCCTPESDYRCPRCNSEDLHFSDYDAPEERETGYSDSGEVARCHDCHWVGDPEDAAPAVQPWAELAAVAEQQPVEIQVEREERPAYREVA